MNAVIAAPDTACLEKLPKELLNYILRFLGDKKTMHRDLHSCETTCKALKAVVGDSLLWSWFRQSLRPSTRDDSRLQSHRYSFRVSKSLRIIAERQKSVVPAFDEVLGREEWNVFLQSIFSECVQQRMLPLVTEPDVSHHFILRPDMSGVLKALIDHHFHHRLYQAMRVGIKMTDENEYPVLCRNHVIVQTRLYETTRAQFQLLIPNMYNTQDDEERAKRLLDAKKRDQIVLKLAYQAGVVVLSNDAYDYVWMDIVRYLTQLLMPVCMMLVGGVEHCEDSNDFPLALDYSVFSNETSTWTHTIEPKHLDQAPPHNSIKVYGPEQHYNVYGKSWSSIDENRDEEADMEMREADPDNESDDEEMDNPSDSEEMDIEASDGEED